MAAVRKPRWVERLRSAPVPSLRACVLVALVGQNATGQSEAPVSEAPVGKAAASETPGSETPSSQAPAQKSPRVSFAAEVGAGLLGTGGEFGRSLSGGLRGRFHWGHWSAGVLVQASGWRSVQVPDSTQEWLGALNLGIGGDYVFAGGFARTSLYLGPSILLAGAWVDAPGPNAGLFADLRPLGLRWPLGAATMRPAWTLAFDPLGVALIMPSTQAIPQLEVQFSTTLGIEVMP